MTWQEIQEKMNGMRATRQEIKEQLDDMCVRMDRVVEKLESDKKKKAILEQSNNDVRIVNFLNLHGLTDEYIDYCLKHKKVD
ncbi:hypothetical protein EZS27_023199 [termite gut metagenome]|uniref:Uncharacterized protein n=1 Tax=termite gut metagenome TaxID=433724 RepID=A0A5J4R2D4_9ZZZZ